MPTPIRKLKREAGQASVLVVLALSIFLVGGLGLAIDGAQLYGHRQKAQTAADAAAEAAMLSVFNGASTTTANSTALNYAQTLNGFNLTGDSVSVDFGNGSSGWAPSGLPLANVPTNLVRVIVSRPVSPTFMKLLGASTSTVKAQAIAAILSKISPIPIIVTHPTLAASLSINGNGTVTITGGPQRAIQVDSDGTLNNPGPPPFSPPNAYNTKGASGNIDLSSAGPSGTGADFAILGSPSTQPGTVTLCPTSGACTGNWVQPASLLSDPLSSVSAPPDPTVTNSLDLNPATGTLSAGSNGCPAGVGSCTLYFPGKYTNNIKVKSTGGPVYAVFAPGIYYMYGSDFSTAANGNMYYATGLTDSSASGVPSLANCCGTGTGWGSAANSPANAGILVYLTGPSSGTTRTTGSINVGANGNVSLVGSPNSSAYKGILFFVDRNAALQTQSLGGGGNMSLVGTIYANTTASLFPNTYQTIAVSGSSGNTTTLTGEIIAGAISLGGTGGITMNLSNASTTVNQVALVQ